jgi:hypothetical protein
MPILIIFLTLIFASALSLYLGKNVKHLEKIVVASSLIELAAAGFAFFNFLAKGRINFTPIFSWMRWEFYFSA